MYFSWISEIFLSYVPEVLNVHMNESEKKIYVLEGFFFQAVQN